MTHTAGATWAKRMIITVSHDRAFLDAVCTDCFHISGTAKKISQTRGNYTLWARHHFRPFSLDFARFPLLFGFGVFIIVQAGKKTHCTLWKIVLQ